MSSLEQSLSAPTNLGRICEAHNKAHAFVQLRNHQLIEAHPSSRNLVAANEVSKLARILLRIVDGTFLALPIDQCRTIVGQFAPVNSSEKAEIQENQGSHYDACLIDWNRAKLLDLYGKDVRFQSLHNTLPHAFHNNIKNLIRPTTLMSQNNINGSNWSHLSILANTSSQTKSPIDYKLVKLTYLSISSLLSIFGILVNLFIIFIIIFNTKQKRRSVIRNNNTNQNNLLLFQLTLTGILLSSYVLFENLNIQNTGVQNVTRLQEMPIVDDDNDEPPPPPLIPPSRQYSPLFNFLPPTPFHSQLRVHSCNPPSITTAYQHTLECACDESSRKGYDSFKFHGMDPLLRASDRNFALILGFGPTLLVPPNDDDIGDAFSGRMEQQQDMRAQLGGSWYLEYYVFEDGSRDDDQESSTRNTSRLIDLSKSLESISVGELHCRRLAWLKGGQGDKDKEMDATRESESDFIDRTSQLDSTHYTDNVLYTSERPKATQRLLSFVAGLLPLAMNVLASVHILTVAALAYDRYCAIAHPLQYLRSIHASRVRTFFILSWTIALLLNLLWPLTLNQIIGFEWSSGSSQPSSIHGGMHKTWVALDDDLHRVENINQNNGSRTRKECQFTTNWLTITQSLSLNANSDCRYPWPGEIYRSIRSNLMRLMDKIETPASDEANKSSLSMATRDRVWAQMGNNLMTVLTTLLVEQPFLGLNTTRSRNHTSNLLAATNPQARYDVAKEEITTNLYIVLLLIYSFLSFLVIILIPLLIITICNISIYRIVKVHERRLSINSGSNVNTSASNLNHSHSYQIHNHHHNQQQLRHMKRDVADDKSETSSITSLLVAKLIKVGLLKGGSSTTAKQDATHIYCSPDQAADQQNCMSANNNCNKLCDCDSARLDCQLNNKIEQQFDGCNQSETNIVNRSKRMIVRQDSYQILAKLHSSSSETTCNQSEFGQTVYSGDGREGRSYSGINKQAGTCYNAPPMFSPPHQCQRARIKRKASDHTIRDFNPRKDSNTSQLSDYHDFDIPDNCSFNESPTKNNFELNGRIYHGSSSNGIMSQLKLAGLSFAGIAIQESSPSAFSGYNFGKPSLLKSSSCSLGSLNHIQSVNMAQNNNNATSVSRCSVETSSSLHVCPRKSFVSLNNNSASKQQDLCNGKYLARLLDDDSDSAQPHGAQNHFNQNNSRLPFTLGTKSPAFNLVIWLILSLLIVTIPQYILETVRQTGRLNSANKYTVEQANFDAQKYYQLLGTMMEFILGYDSGVRADKKIPKEFYNLSQYYQSGERADAASGRTIWEISSVWLSCICRILFLSILPLNGWLYGIRSKSLRATLRVVLKRYISRRQASIEINQRQRSLTSVRSRDSSFINLPPLYYNHNSSICASCNYQTSSKSPERLFRRCSSFTGTKRDNLLHDNSPVQPFTMNATADDISPEDDSSIGHAQVPVIKFKGTNTSTIRFSIGDCSLDKATDSPLAPLNQHPTDSIPQYYSHTVSPTLSMASSDRSLVSASIHSAHSLLFDDRRMQDYSVLSLNHTNQKTIFGHSTEDGSPTKMAHDVLNNEISEIDQTLKIILNKSRHISSSEQNKIGHKIGSQAISKSNSLSGANAQTTIRNFDRTTLPIAARNGAKAGNREDKLQHRCSAEPTRINSLSNTMTNDSSTECQLKKSSSDFKFFITSADQEQHVVDFGHDDHSKPTIKKDVTIDLFDGDRLQTKVADTDNERHSGDWWGQLKVNLTKLISTSAKLLPSNLIKPQRRAVRHNTGDCNWHDSLDHMVDTEDQCSRALLRKSSLDGRGPSDWPRDLLINGCGSNNSISGGSSSSNQSPMSANKRKRKKKRLKTSLTLDDINSIKKNNEFNSHRRCSSNQATYSKDSSTKTLNQSPTYLKPPNFLKLIFDPNANTCPYSGPSALSPIKECSSNHSYASSQSSLNNTTQHSATNHAIIGEQYNNAIMNSCSDS